MLKNTTKCGKYLHFSEINTLDRFTSEIPEEGFAKDLKFYKKMLAHLMVTIFGHRNLSKHLRFELFFINNSSTSFICLGKNKQTPLFCVSANIILYHKCSHCTQQIPVPILGK